MCVFYHFMSHQYRFCRQGSSMTAFHKLHDQTGKWAWQVTGLKMIVISGSKLSICFLNVTCPSFNTYRLPMSHEFRWTIHPSDSCMIISWHESYTAVQDHRRRRREFIAFNYNIISLPQSSAKNREATNMTNIAFTAAWGSTAAAYFKVYFTILT